MIRKMIDRPIAVTMVMIAVIVLGFVASGLLPVSLMPEVDIPQITVRVNTPNTSARELQASVIGPLQSQLMQANHLKEIRAEAKDGGGIIFLQFDYGTDIDYLFIDVNERIDRAMNSLPKDIERPVVVKASATDIPAFYLNLTLRKSSGPHGKAQENRLIELSNFAATVIAKRLEQLPEVAFVDMSGRIYGELIIVPDLAKLEGLGLELSVLEQAIQASQVNMGNLTVRDGQYQYNVRFSSMITGRQDLERIPVNAQGRIYRLDELASVVEQSQKYEGMVVSDGEQGVSMAVIKQNDARMGDLKASINRTAEYFERDYPDVKFTLTRDQTRLLDYSIGNLEDNLLIGALLACLVIFLFMQDLRMPVLVTMTIPLSLLVSLLFFFLVGISINVVSLSGLILGLGMMVDNSIIVIDNVTQRWERGDTLRDAVVGGTTEVFAPLLSSVLTTCSIFLPLIFLSGMAGAMFYDQAMAVSIGLASSLLVAMTVIPVYYYLFYKKKNRPVKNRILMKIGVRDMAGPYERSLKWVFRHQRLVWGGLLLFTLSGIGTWRLLNKQVMPDVEKNDILLRVDWNTPITIEENGRRTARLVAALEDIGGLAHYTSMVGKQQFVLSHTAEGSKNEALVYVQMMDNEELTHVIERGRKFIRETYPEATYLEQEAGNIFEMIFSDDRAELTARLRPVSAPSVEADKLNPLLSALDQKLQDVYIEPVSWQEHITLYADRELMTLYGVDYGSLYYTLKSALNENQILQINQGQYVLPVLLGQGGEMTVRDILREKTVLSKDKTEVPVNLLVLESIDRDIRNIISGTEGEYYPLHLDIPSDRVPAAMDRVRNAVAQNDDFEVNFTGAWFESREMTWQLFIVLGISLLLLYFILASQFESLVQPFIIMFEIVVDVAGALLILWSCGSSINLMSMIGLVVMSGIVINDSILKVDTFNRLRRRGYGTLKAVMTGGDRRLKPIIMTSLTTILAILPFLFSGGMGNDLQRPLSLAIIGGMTVGTIVSIYGLPLLYYYIYRNKK